MIAVLTPFFGRRLWWEWWIQAFELLEFDRSELCVFWIDDSGDPEFGQLLASYVAEHRQHYRRFELRPGPRSGKTGNERIAANYGELRNAVFESGERMRSQVLRRAGRIAVGQSWACMMCGMNWKSLQICSAALERKPKRKALSI